MIEICKSWREEARGRLVSSPGQSQEWLCIASGAVTLVQVQVFFTCYLCDYRQVTKENYCSIKEEFEGELGQR